MNRFAALDIDEFEPDRVEQEQELLENVREAEKAGMGPQLEDLKKLRAYQRAGGTTQRFPTVLEQISQADPVLATRLAKRAHDGLDSKVEIEEFFERGTQYVISRGPPHVWRRKDGSTLLVEAMSDTHLLNSARLLLRKLEEGRPQRQIRFSLKVLKLEADHRGRLL